VVTIAQVLYGDYNPSEITHDFPEVAKVYYYNYKTQVVQKWLNLVMYLSHYIEKNDASDMVC
jgi:hypothetical protein